MTISKIVIAATEARTERSRVLLFIGTDDGRFSKPAQTGNPIRTPYGTERYLSAKPPVFFVTPTDLRPSSSSQKLYF